MNKSSTITINYDPQHDVLYLSRGEPVASYSNEANYDGPGKILIRSSMEGGDLTGVTILDYSRVPKEKLKEFIQFHVNWNKVDKKVREEYPEVNL